MSYVCTVGSASFDCDFLNLLLVITMNVFCDYHLNCILLLVPMMEARSKVFDLLQISEKDDSLKSETATLARLYYKFTNQWRREKCLGDMKQVINSFIPDISIALLQVHYYSEAILTTALILCRR